MMKNHYHIEKILDCLENRGWTNFIPPQDYLLIQSKIGKKSYFVYSLYPDATKVILYRNEKPCVHLLRIQVSGEVKHSDVMGTIYSLGIKEDLFGDIVKFEGNFYIFLMDTIFSYVFYNLLEIKGERCTLEEVPLQVAASFRIEYEKIEVLVSSLRIDTVLSSLIHVSRNDVFEMHKDKNIVLNYRDDFKLTRPFREDDVFSIRRYGKYKFGKVLRETKKGSQVIEILKYK